MKPSSDTAMIPMRSHQSSALIALVACTLLLGACSSLSRKPSGSADNGNPSASADKPAPKPVDLGNPDARFKAALDQLKQGQTQEAETALTGLIKDFPQYSGPLTELGLIYAKSKRFDLAAAAFAKATAANPQNAVAYNWQGILYREANNYGGAEKAYQRAISADSNYANAHLNLGILYDVYLKRPKDALEQYKEYQRLGGADDLRVLVWVADLEKAKAAADAPAAPVAAPTAPTPAAAPVKPKQTEKKP